MEVLSPKVERVIRQGLGYKDMPKLDLNEYDVYNEIKEDHPMYKRLVREVLENYEPATNNDLILYLEVLRVLKKIFVEDKGDYVKITIRKSDIAYIPQSESITRARRSLNQRGICLPTDEEVLIRRSTRCKAMRKYMGEQANDM